MLEGAKKFLQQYPMIRVFVPSAPGLGHQSAASVTLQRLRELGYTGKLEVVYDNDAKDKMDIVLPGFEPTGPDIQDIADSDAVTIPMSALWENGQQLPFGIVAASDFQLAPSSLLVVRLLTLQPFLWGPASLKAPGTPEIKNTNKALKPMPWVYHLPDPKDPSAFIAQETSLSSRFKDKTAGLQTLASALESKNLLPVYDNPDKNGILKLMALLLGLQQAQGKKPDSFKSGGVLLPVFWSIDDAGIRDLKYRISREPSLNGKVRVLSVTDPDLAKNIGALRQGESFVIGVGNVPRKIFEFLYEKADLPPLAAGVNAQNLLYLLGKPFFHTLYRQSKSLFEEHRFKRILERASDESRSLFGNAQHALADLPWNAGSDMLKSSARHIADFILAALEPDSAIRKIFEKTRVPDQRLDKLLLALNATRKALDAQSLGLADP